jgi:hypothetical protein
MKKTNRKIDAVCQRTGLLVAVTLLWPSSTGCALHRTVVNEHVRDLDPSTLRIGETTWTDAVRELGPPVSANTPHQLLRADVQQRSLKYVAAESTAVRLMIPLMVAALPVRWSDTQNSYELLLEFDENQRLTGVYETCRETIWQPFESEPKRPPPVTRTILGGGS